MGGGANLRRRSESEGGEDNATEIPGDAKVVSPRFFEHHLDGPRNEREQPEIAMADSVVTIVVARPYVEFGELPSMPSIEIELITAATMRAA